MLSTYALLTSKQTQQATPETQTSCVSNITAFFVYEHEASKELVVALDSMDASEKWILVKLKIDVDIATAFRCIKVPALILYNGRNEETSRVFGEANIIDLINKVLE
jgi:hypothetical protein